MFFTAHRLTHCTLPQLTLATTYRLPQLTVTARTYAKKATPSQKTPEQDFDLQKYTLKMQKSITALESNFSKIRVSRPSPSLLDTTPIQISHTTQPLSKVASVHVKDAFTFIITTAQEPILKPISMAIKKLGFNPQKVDENTIQVNIPKMTFERKQEMKKEIQTMGEKTRVVVRGVRQEARKALKGLTEDQVKLWEKKVQEETDSWIKKIDFLVSTKEKELL
jgi:ribosome recycling factor